MSALLMAAWPTPEALSATFPPAFVLATDAKGHAEPSRKSAVTRPFAKLERVWITKRSRNGEEDASYFLVKGTDGQPASQLMGPLPSAWLPVEAAVLIPDMQAWQGCWPIEELVFADGVIDVRVVLDNRGIGSISYTEGPANVRAKVYFAGDVVDIRDTRQGASYLFVLSRSEQPKLASPDYQVSQSKVRRCQ